MPCLMISLRSMQGLNNLPKSKGKNDERTKKN
jgi:hypothetical protein